MESHFEFRRREFASFLKSRKSLPTSPTNVSPLPAQVESETLSIPSTTTAVTTTPSSYTLAASAYVLPPLPPSPFTTTSELINRPHPTSTVSYHSAPTLSKPVCFPPTKERATVYRPISTPAPASFPHLSAKTTLPPIPNSSATASFGTSFPSKSVSRVLPVDVAQEIRSQTAVQSTSTSFLKTDVGSGKKRPRDGNFSDEGDAAKTRRVNEKVYAGNTSPVAVSNVINAKTPSSSEDKIKSKEKDEGNSSSNAPGKGKKEVRHCFHEQLIDISVKL